MSLGNKVLLYAALLPAIILFVYVYNKDKVEKEPLGLVLRLVGFGALAGPIAMVAETLIIGTFEAIIPIKIVFFILKFFIGVAFVEEGLKYLFLSTIRKNPEFNYVFDGVVYAVAVTLGFATLENILYVFSYGLSTAIVRALLSVPGHCAYGVIMGCFFGLARHREISGNASEAKLYYWLALILPVIEHGFYDAGISSGNGIVILIALGLQVSIIIAAMILVHKLSMIDKAFYPQTSQPSTPQQTQVPPQAYAPQQNQIPQQVQAASQAQAPQQQVPVRQAQPSQYMQTPQQQWQPQGQTPPQWQPAQQAQRQIPQQAPQPQAPQQTQMPQQLQPQQNSMPTQVPLQAQTPLQQWQTPPQQR